MISINVKYQQLLKSLGLYNGALDGKYGPKTREAIMKFQHMNGLKADGIIGRMTLAALNEDLQEIEDRQTDSIRGVPTDKTFKPWPKESTASLMKFYGQPGENQTIMDTPYKMKLAWDPKTTITRFSCHEKVANSLYRVLSNIAKAYTPQQIAAYGFDMFGGCLNVRPIRGGTRWSVHAWGAAIDLDPARNRLKWGRDKAFFARPECADFLACWREEGWYSLGPNKGYDYMHHQACYR